MIILVEWKNVKARKRRQDAEKKHIHTQTGRRQTIVYRSKSMKTFFDRIRIK